MSAGAPVRALGLTLLVLACFAPGAAARSTGAVPAAPRPSLTVGIGDQKPDMFTAPLFTSLELRHVRLVVPWDAMDSSWQRADLRTWLEAARTAGVSPLLTFGHSRLAVHYRVRPTPTQLLRQFHRLRAAFPWVRDYATWNEPNHCGELLCRKPELAARYYDALHRSCPSCRILAAEVLDTVNMVWWVRRFRKAVRSEPRYWGLHNYVDANRFRTKGTEALLKATRGQVWFTETGGIVARTAVARIPFPESTAHAAQATRWLFDRLVPLSPRITRVYLYHWSSGGPESTWDSALVNVHGLPRAAFRVLKVRLASQRARAQAAAAAAAR